MEGDIAPSEAQLQGTHVMHLELIAYRLEHSLEFYL